MYMQNMETSNTTTILVIDDHNGFRRSVIHLLQSSDSYQVIGEASNSIEGLALACALSPQVVLLDIRMPGLNGLTIIEKMRATLPNLIVVVLTLWDSPEYRHAALVDHKANAYIIKENVVAELLPTLNKLLNIKV